MGFRYPSPTFGGVMSTASGLVFAGDHEGNFMAFNAESGKICGTTKQAQEFGGCSDPLYARGVYST
ncbi:MAG: hypothetical protein Ct9H90mP25_0320 [Gammaproteobacteria bacterium]|nr:MAG: hypothetical protein Ct9H90mP25_0320 [Gammaproteobacteria bacterium]